MRTVFLLLLTVSGLTAQNKQLLYDFTSVPQSLLTNPGAQIENRLFVGIPMLSHIHLNAGSSGLSAYNLFASDGIDFNIKLKDAIYKLAAKDNMTFTQQLDIVSAGFALKNSGTYLSFGMYQETDFHMYFPKDYSHLAYEGNANNIGKVYDLSHLNVTAELLSVFYVGYHKQLNEKFRFGIRGKIYSSTANIKATTNNGQFVTTQGDDNFYNHKFDLDLEVKTAGVKSLLENDNSDIKNDLKELRRRMLFGGNLGVGVDVGFTFDFLNNWTATMSILDVGTIFQTKDVENYVVKGEYTFKGVNPLFPANQTPEDNNYWSIVSNRFKELFKVDTTSTAYISWRPVKFNASIKYSFYKKSTSKTCDCLGKSKVSKINVGAHLYSIKRPKGFQSALTVYGEKEFFNFLWLRGAYTVDRYSYTNLGLGLSARLGPVNFYMMADNLLSYRNLAKANSASVQLGFNYIIDKSD